MNAKELRIGNKIRYSQHILTVKKLGHPHIEWVITEEMIDGNLNHYDGIPLTPEIVENAGLILICDEGDIVFYGLPEIKNGYGVCFNHHCLEFVKYNISDGDAIENTCLMYDDDSFQYLHQLQNLYFALTGTELIITF